MRGVVCAAGALVTVACAYLATAHCCERVNVLASLGLTEPGCSGLSQYRVLFALASLVSLAAIVAFVLYGPGARRNTSVLGATWLTLLATVTGLLVFVVP